MTNERLDELRDIVATHERLDFDEAIEVLDALATVRAERDRLLAAVVAQAEASVRGVSVRLDDLRAWLDAIEATETLARELRGGGR